MITYVKGNIFDSSCAALVCPVNCRGVMGAGLAKQFKQRFPKMFEAYKEGCDHKQLWPGGLHIWWGDPDLDEPQQIIINMATKDDWRDLSKLEWIQEGLWNLRDRMMFFNIESVAIPPIGCGLGMLNWDEVRREIEREFGDSTFNVEVYEPLH